MDEKGEGNFSNVTNFPFGNNILLSAGIRDVIRNPISVEIFSKSNFDEFWRSFALKKFDSSGEKIFNIGFKVLKMGKSFEFCG